MQYKVLVGLDYPPNKRAEPGDTVDDLPGSSIGWLRDQGLIEPVEGKAPAKKTAAPKRPRTIAVEED